MDVDKAIGILTLTSRNLKGSLGYDGVEAQQLGIEALKAWAEKRRGMPHPDLWLLPGESKGE